MNLELKVELIRRFGSQAAAARALAMRESKLSRIIRGWEIPSKREIEIFERVLGRPLVKKVFRT